MKTLSVRVETAAGASLRSDAPDVFIRPPRLFLFGLILGGGLGWLWPAAVWPLGLRLTLSGFLIVLGVIIMAIGYRQFRAVGTYVKTIEPTLVLVTNGLFRFSRNPFYISLILIYLGIGVVINNLWIFALLVPLLVVLHYGVILREERYLEGKFGADYLNYKATVRRWL